MKITAPGSLSTTAVGQGGGKPAAAGGFKVDSSEDAGATSSTRTLGVSGVGSVDALIALQQVEDPRGRRRRAVGRAGRLLDVLEQVKLTLLDGDPAPSDLQRLAAAVREERAATDDAGLEGLLDQIETRAAVEIAKMQVRLQAA